jgi:predicted PolB exonuclease-like 3'-5' exonuclease
MIIALDIETVGNMEAAKNLPEPKANGRLKDPAKIAADIAEKKAEQIEKLALDPLTGRIIAAAAVKIDDGDEWCGIIDEATDAKEMVLIETILNIICDDDTRLVTFNGAGFDLPYIYKRALILGVPIGGVPPLSAWLKRYTTDKHIDRMEVWTNWGGYVGLNTLAKMILGRSKAEIDVMMFPEMLKTEEGRKQMQDYNLQDARLTAELFKKMRGVLIP